MSRFYDREGHPLDLWTWARSMQNPDYQRVARDELENGTVISTVWLGLDHAFLGGPPLIFETMVFSEGWSDLEQQRYTTEAEAIAGHRVMVEKYTTPNFTIEDILRGGDGDNA